MDARKCDCYVYDASGSMAFACERKVKFRVSYDDGRRMAYRCAIHARRLPAYATRTPLAPPHSEKGV